MMTVSTERSASAELGGEKKVERFGCGDENFAGISFETRAFLGFVSPVRMLMVGWWMGVPLLVGEGGDAG